MPGKLLQVKGTLALGQPHCAASTLSLVHNKDAAQLAQARQHANRHGGAHGNTIDEYDRSGYSKWKQRDHRKCKQK